MGTLSTASGECLSKIRGELSQRCANLTPEEKDFIKTNQVSQEQLENGVLQLLQRMTTEQRRLADQRNLTEEAYAVKWLFSKFSEAIRKDSFEFVRVYIQPDGNIGFEPNFELQEDLIKERQ